MVFQKFIDRHECELARYRRRWCKHQDGGFFRIRHQPAFRALAHSGPTFAQLALMMAEAPTFDGVAVTMTGELADCYATREGAFAVFLNRSARFCLPTWFACTAWTLRG